MKTKILADFRICISVPLNAALHSEVLLKTDILGVWEKKEEFGKFKGKKHSGQEHFH